MDYYTFKKDEQRLKSFAELLGDYDIFTIAEAYLNPMYAFFKSFKEGYDYDRRQEDIFS
jgi:hypothetical protein